MADHDTHDHTGIPGVGGSTDLDAIIAASAGQDIADALSGAAAPDAGNVFATIADVGGGGGALVWLQRQTASNASPNLDFTGFVSSTYQLYQFEFTNLLPATNNVDFLMQVSTDGGANYINSAAAYTNATFRWHSGAANATTGGTSTSILACGFDHISNNSSWNGLSGWCKLWHPAATGFKKITGESMHADGTTAVLEIAAWTGTYTTTTAVDAIRFLMSSGNIVTGTIDCYGVTHA